jgi:hypothetical protein
MSRLGALLALAMLLPLRAAAGEGSLGPDGTVVTRATFPSELVLRPLVTPLGLLTAELTFGVDLSPSVSPYLKATVSYGVGDHLELGVEGLALGTYGGGIFARYQFAPNVAGNVWGQFAVDLQGGAPLNVAQIGLGLPLKWKFPGVPIALTGLGTVFLVTYEQASAGGVDAYDRTLTQLQIPVTLQISPVPVFSLELGVQGVVKTSDTLGSDVASPNPLSSSAAGDVLAWGALSLTLRHFDVGLSGGYEVFFQLPVQGLAYCALTGAVRFW